MDSVVSDAGGVLKATRAAKTLHGDTAKHPRPQFWGLRESFFRVLRRPMIRVISFDEI